MLLKFKQRSHWMLRNRCAEWQQSLPLPSWGEDRSSVHKRTHEKDRKHVILSQIIQPANTCESKKVFIFRFVYIYNFTMGSFSNWIYWKEDGTQYTRLKKHIQSNKILSWIDWLIYCYKIGGLLTILLGSIDFLATWLPGLRF